MNSAETLASCVASLRSSMQLAESSIAILDTGVRDFPRLATVLTTSKHFELVSEAELKEAQSALASEIGPELETLLSRVDAYLDRLARRERSLMSKCELQEGRLSRDEEGEERRRSSRARRSATRSPGTGMGTVTASGASRLEEMRMQQLRQKKERLNYAVERLELQASQRQRQLRKSLAPV